MRIYLLLWLLITALIGFEYWSLTFRPEISFLLKAQRHGWISAASVLNIERGGTLSLWVGWIGSGAMLVMNLYSVRRRLPSLIPAGRLSSWLNFHIFCGILGPTLILFHCSLKVRGLVGISFWSMVVSFSSGIVGRYFFLQLSQKKGELDSESDTWLKGLDQLLAKSKVPDNKELKSRVLSSAVEFVGGGRGGGTVSPLGAVWLSCLGDLRLMFSDPGVPNNWPQGRARIYLTNYAVSVRKAKFLSSFQRLMGHWHAFHFPFAVFMYITAIIHIISSLIFPKA